jgi:hypothetical protein
MTALSTSIFLFHFVLARYVLFKSLAQFERARFERSERAKTSRSKFVAGEFMCAFEKSYTERPLPSEMCKRLV